MSIKKLTIISSGQLRVEKISLDFLSAIMKPLQSFDFEVNWFGTFWNDEVFDSSCLDEIKRAGCNVELIEPLTDDLLGEWSRKISPQKDHIPRSAISQYYCKEASLNRALKLIGDSYETHKYLYFRPDCALISQYIRLNGKRGTSFPGIINSLKKIESMEKGTVITAKLALATVFEKSDKLVVKMLHNLSREVYIKNRLSCQFYIQSNQK